MCGRAFTSYSSGYQRLDGSTTQNLKLILLQQLLFLMIWESCGAHYLHIIYTLPVQICLCRPPASSPSEDPFVL